MHRYLVLLFLCACGPKILGDTDSGDDPSSGGDLSGTSGSVGSAGGTTAAPTSAGTTGEHASSTSTTEGQHETMAPTVTSIGSETEGPPPGTTDAPDPGGLQVFMLHGEPGPHSGLEGVALWQSAVPPSCDAPPPASCAELPTLGAPQILVDGGFPGPDAVELGSRVAVLFPFAHPACELGCGDDTFTVLIGDGGDGGQGIGQIPVDLPCSTEASDVWLGIDFNVVTLPQQYTAKLELKDRCGANTQERTLVFTPK